VCFITVDHTFHRKNPLLHQKSPSYEACWITEWRRLIGCLKLKVIFRKRATNYRALLRKMTYEDKASCDSTPPCTKSCRACVWWCTIETPHAHHHMRVHIYFLPFLTCMQIYIWHSLYAYTYAYMCVTLSVVHHHMRMQIHFLPFLTANCR